VIENINYDEYTIAFRFHDDIMYSYVFSGPSFSLGKKFDKLFNTLKEFDWLTRLGKSIVIETRKSEIEALNSIINNIFNK
ncbi:MAG: hypothetical protein ACW99A_21230, partial [Candidatus Kariarchaeaceae archaeon]